MILQIECLVVLPINETLPNGERRPAGRWLYEMRVSCPYKGGCEERAGQAPPLQGSDGGRLLAPVPVTQWREEKDGQARWSVRKR